MYIIQIQINIYAKKLLINQYKYKYKKMEQSDRSMDTNQQLEDLLLNPQNDVQQNIMIREPLQLLNSRQRSYIERVYNQIMNQLKMQLKQRTSRIEEAQRFINAQTAFKEDLTGLQEVYLVSCKWMNKWKQYVSYDKVKQQEVVKWDQLFTQSQLGCMNEDLVEDPDNTSIQFQEGLEFLNTISKRSLVQKQDFIFVNQQIWDILKIYKHIQIKRWVFYNQSLQSYEVEHCPLMIKVIFISKRIIKLMKAKMIRDLPCQTVQFSCRSTLAYFELATAQIFSKKLRQIFEFKTFDQIDYDSICTKLALLDPNQNYQSVNKKLRSTISKVASQDCFTLFLNIKQGLDFQASIQSVIPNKELTLIFQFSQKEQKPSGILICHPTDANPVSQCPKCKHLKTLGNKCSCKLVSYCSEQCQKADKFHRELCQARRKISQNHTIASQMRKRSGYVGIRNSNNDCYMNSALQCLSNIYELSHYFISQQYLNVIRQLRPTNLNRTLSEQYADVLQVLWNPNNIVCNPYMFRRRFIDAFKMFNRERQHDACQFLTFFLNEIHEQLNRANSRARKNRQDRETDLRAQQIIAQEYWNDYLTQNNSIITDFFFGQYKSSVKCTKCKYQSLRFEPFMTTALPLPLGPDGGYKVVFVVQNDETHLDKKFVNFYSESQNLSNAVKITKKYFNISPQSKVLLYNSRSLIPQQKHKEIMMAKLKNKMFYFRILTPKQHQDGYKFLVSYNYSLQNFRNQGFQNKAIIRLYRFDKKLTLSGLIEALYGLNKEICDVGQFKQYLQNNERQKYKIKIQYNCSYQHGNICPGCHRSKCPGCIIQYSNKKTIQTVFSASQFNFIKYNIVQKPSALCGQQERDFLKMTHIHECFKNFQKQQILTGDECWNCPKCKEKVTAIKKVQIYKGPKILILYFKRFRREGNIFSKNSAFIRFPMSLDLTDYIVNPELPKFNELPQEKNSDKKMPQRILNEILLQKAEKQQEKFQPPQQNLNKNAGQKPLANNQMNLLEHKQQQTMQRITTNQNNAVLQQNQKPTKEKILYDLFALIDHIGQNSNSGHYTAACKNLASNSWLRFDDEKVRKTESKKIITNQAYILFYRRRQN